MEQMDDNNDGESRLSPRVCPPSEGEADGSESLADNHPMTHEVSSYRDERKTTEVISDNRSVSQVDQIDEIRKLVAFAQRSNGSWEETEARRRKAVLDAAQLMLRLVSEGYRRTHLYREVGLSREEGRHYLKLAEVYVECTPEEIERLTSEGILLSLNQAAALALAMRRVKPSDQVRLKRLVRETCPEPQAIAKMAMQTSNEAKRLAELLDIHPKEVERLRAEAPRSPETFVEITNGRIVILCGAQPTLPLVFAALTSRAEIYGRVKDAIRLGCIIEIRRAKGN